MNPLHEARLKLRRELEAPPPLRSASLLTGTGVCSGLLDRLFGTHYLPGDKWPSGYGIAGHPVPAGYTAQFAYPFRRAPQNPSKS
jgi:hypothetical protein